MAGTRGSDAVQSVLEASVRGLGFDLEHVDIVTAGRRRIVRVAVDRDGGVSLDDIADASRAVSAALDDSQVMGERPYILEVASRGVDSPLTRSRHWRRNVGRLVRVGLRDGSTLTGRIARADDDSVAVETEQGERALRLDDVATARVQVEFARPHSEAVESMGVGGAQRTGKDA